MGEQGHVESATRWATMELVGGALCLDFANTVEGREGEDRRDAIHGPDDSVRWGVRAGALTQDEGERLAVALEADPDALRLSFGRAIALREAIYRVFTAIARDRPPSPSDLDAVQEGYADAMQHATIAPRVSEPRGSFAWTWETAEPPSLDPLRWRVSESAIELLRHGRLDRLRQCPGSGDGPCNWLFIDTTRGGNRRWCSMFDCGGRAKWRRQNARRRRQHT